MSEEGITAEFSIADDVQPDPCLKVNCLIDSRSSMRLNSASLSSRHRGAHGPVSNSSAQKTSNRIAAEIEHEYLQGIGTPRFSPQTLAQIACSPEVLP